MDRPNRSTLQRFLLYYIPVLLVLILAAGSLYLTRRSSVMRLFRAQEQTRAQGLEQVIRQRFRSITSDLHALAEHTADVVEKDGGGSVTVGSALPEIYEIFSASKGVYDQVRFLDTRGMERVRVDYHMGEPVVISPDQLQDKSRRYYFTDTISLQPDEVFVSPLDLNIEHGVLEQPIKPMIRFGQICRDDAGQLLGVVLLNYLGQDLLGALDRSAQGSRTRTMLLNADGYWLSGASEADGWGFMYPDRKDRTFAGRHPEQWALISSDETGQFEAPEGLVTFTTIYPLAEGLQSSTGSPEAFARSVARLSAREYRWKLVSITPWSAFDAQMGWFLRTTVLSAAVLAVVFGWGTAVVARSQRRRDDALARERQLVEELQDALHNVRVLRGLLPICASCKKIRDDSGYWQQIESYVTTHSEAEFSHGICPECSKKLYGDLLSPDELDALADPDAESENRS